MGKKEYRERIYIRKDILLKLYEHGEMNQTRLLNSCGLNNVKHKSILDDMVTKEFLNKQQVKIGHKITIQYKILPKGLEVLELLFGPYERLFPRDEKK